MARVFSAARRFPAWPDGRRVRGPSRSLAGVVLLGAVAGLGAACPEKQDPVPPGPPPASPPAAAAVPEVAPPPAFVEKQPGARALVLFTASVQGYVAPCGCTAEPLGGVARLAAALDEASAKSHGQIIFVDAGDLLFEREDDNLPADACQAEARHELLLSTYARKGLAGTTLGPLDDVRGPAYRDALLAKHAVPTLGVNLPRPLTEGAPHQRSRVVKAGETPIGLTAFFAATADDVAIARAELEKEVKVLQGQGALAVVVLAQAKKSKAAQVVDGLAGVDVVILGHEPGEAPISPTRLGEAGPILVAAGMQAQHLGVLELELEGRTSGAPRPLALDDRQGEAERRARVLDARIHQYERQVESTDPGARRDFIEQKLQAARAERARVFTDALQKPPPPAPYVTARAVALPRGRSEEPEAAQGLAAYEAAIPQLVRTCEATIECPAPAEGQATYVGVETCFQCHKEAVKFWRAQRVELPYTDEDGQAKVRLVGHSKAWQTLLDEKKHEDRTCVGCHSIGFNQPGGYCRVSEVDFRIDVQCEACHGPGSNHVKNSGDKAALTSVTEATCRGCHHVPHIPTTESFVFEDKLTHILGPGHGALRLEKLKAARGG